MRARVFVLGTMVIIGIFLLNCGAGWVTDKYPKSPNAIIGKGFGESKLLQNAIDEATLVARQKIAEQIEARIKGYQIRFVKETGLPEDADIMRQFATATKQITSTTLYGSKVIEEKYKERKKVNTARVTVEYPIGEANQELVNQLKKNRNWKTEYEKTKLCEELEKEIKDYEQWKKEQGY